MQLITGIFIGVGVASALAAFLHDYPTFDPRYSWLTVVVPIFSGVFIALVANELNIRRERINKENEFRRFRVSLLHELSNRVAACVIDYHLPWMGYGLKSSKSIRSLKAVYKFKPIDPVIYPKAGEIIGRLEQESAKALIHFYSAFFRWKREIDDAEHSAIETSLKGKMTLSVLPGDLLRMSRRLGETLEPGLQALRTLKSEIGPEADGIIKQHFEAHYAFLTSKDPRYEYVNNIRPFELLNFLIEQAKLQKEDHMEFVKHY